MDKETIIDGVDVSGCRQYMHRYMEDYDIDTLDYCRYHFKPCKDVDVKYCYYKQLKRKEQECEELKEQLKRKEENYQKLLNKSNKYIHNLVDENVQDISNLARQLEQLKAENEKLKKQVCGLRPELKSIIDEICSKYNIEAKYYHEKIVEITNNLDKYEQTLTEIKFLVRELLKAVPYEIKQILQKISEVNNDR